MRAILLLMIALAQPGCLTVLQAIDSGEGPAAFGGTRLWVSVVGDAARGPAPPPDAPGCGPPRWLVILGGIGVLLDLPASLALDTALLPASLANELLRDRVRLRRR